MSGGLVHDKIMSDDKLKQLVDNFTLDPEALSIHILKVNGAFVKYHVVGGFNGN